MVARTWHGMVRPEKADEYLHLLRTVGLRDYKMIPGNRGAYVLERKERDRVHFLLVSFWDDVEAIKRYAGDDIQVPRHEPFDAEFLIEMEDSIAHHTVFTE